MLEEINYDKMIFAANLKRLMRRERESQSDIARLLNVSRATVSSYCSGTQFPRIDKIEQLAYHFGVSRAELIENCNPDTGYYSPGKISVVSHTPASPIRRIYDALNESGQSELLRYGRYLASRDEFCAGAPTIEYIKHFLVPAAAGYASPIEGEDYELLERDANMPPNADFCITIRGDSMEPYIRDGQLVYVRRGAELSEFDVGIFFVDGDVFCKQWCVDYAGTLHLLSANSARQDANITIPRSANRNCVCFGKVLLPEKLPKPVYW